MQNGNLALTGIRWSTIYGCTSPWALRWPGAKPLFGAASAYLEAEIRTNVYIDGFNFYYGALRKTAYRWIDIRRLCEFLLPRNTIADIKYFTALVSARPGDLDQPERQQLFLRALRTVPSASAAYRFHQADTCRGIGCVSVPGGDARCDRDIYEAGGVVTPIGTIPCRVGCEGPLQPRVVESDETCQLYGWMRCKILRQIRLTRR